MKMRLTSLALFGGLCYCCLAADPAPCRVIDSADRTRLTTYVQKKYNLPQATLVEIREDSIVVGTCFHKLEFGSVGVRTFHANLFASPDLRFLTRELFDSHVDPDEETRRQARALIADLAKGNNASLGPSDAPVTLVVFSDFQCPFCSQMAIGIKGDIIPQNAGKIHLIFRNFPLPMHGWARAAAEAAACAKTQDDRYFWSLHDYIFTHQRDLTKANMTEKFTEQLATMDGFDAVRFTGCIEKRETADRIDRDIQFGKEMKVEATPTLFVNGQRVSGYRAEEIRTLIRENIVNDTRFSK